MTENEAIGYLRMATDEVGNEEFSDVYKEMCKLAIQALEEIQAYREMEQKLQSVYGEHDGLLNIVIDGLMQYENAPDKAIKSVLLTNDDVEKWQQYRAIGTVEELQALKEKSVAKKPKYQKIKYGKHKWRTDEDGEVDEFAWESGLCNGVACEVCGQTECIFCNPDYDKLKDCEMEFNRCPSCNEKVYSINSHCKKCNQKIDW